MTRGYIGDGDWDLQVGGSDPAPEGASDPLVEKRASGVRKIEVYVDQMTTPAQTFTQGTESQGLSGTWFFETDQPGRGEGHHEIRVVVTDFANNVAEQTLGVDVDFTPDDPRMMQTGPNDGDFGEGGYEPCTPDPETGESYCGEVDTSGSDPQLAAIDSEPAVTSGQRTTLAVGGLLRLPLAQRSAAPGAATAASGSVGPTIGLSDNNDIATVNPYQDPRFRDLGIRRTRIIVPWNVVSRATAAMTSSKETGPIRSAAACRRATT